MILEPREFPILFSFARTMATPDNVVTLSPRLQPLAFISAWALVPAEPPAVVGRLERGVRHHFAPPEIRLARVILQR